MYILNTKSGDYWVSLSPEKEGWLGVGKDSDWIGSYPNLEAAVKEVNRRSNSLFTCDSLFEVGETPYQITELAA